MNSDIRKAIRKRNRLLKYYCRHKSPRAWENYRVQRNLTTFLIRTAKEKYYTNLSDKLQDPEIGHKKWWGIIKSLYGNKIHSNIPALLEGDWMITDAKEKATLFNDYFCSVGYVRLKIVTLLYRVYLLFKIQSALLIFLLLNKK